MPRWQPGNFRGLRVGRARKADVLRVLGPPGKELRAGEPELRAQRSASAASGEAIALELCYPGRGEHGGEIRVRLDRRGTVLEIQESFPVALPRTAIYRELGAEAMTAHYSFAPCGPGLLREPRGALELTLYPRLGVALWPERSGYDFAALLYLARAPGLARRPGCSGR